MVLLENDTYDQVLNTDCCVRTLVGKEVNLSLHLHIGDLARARGITVQLQLTSPAARA